MVDNTMHESPMARDTRREPERAAPADAERSAFQFNERHREGLPELLHELADDGGHLAQQQMRLMQAEVRSAITDIEESIAAMAGAGVVGIAALGVLLMSASFLLGSAMPLWLGTLIVGVVALGIAYAMFAAGKSKLRSKSMTMDRTRRTIERAPEAMTGSNSEVRHGR